MLGAAAGLQSRSPQDVAGSMARDEDDVETMYRLRNARRQLSMIDEKTCLAHAAKLETATLRRDQLGLSPPEGAAESVLTRRRSVAPSDDSLPDSLMLDLSGVKTPDFIDTERRRINGEDGEESIPPPQECSGSRFGLGALNAVEVDERVWHWIEYNPDGGMPATDTTLTDCPQGRARAASHTSATDADWIWALHPLRTDDTLVYL